MIPTSGGFLRSNRRFPRFPTGLATLVAIAIASSIAVSPAGPAAADTSQPNGPASPTVSRKAIPLDGFTITHLPDGVGKRESEFRYEWEDVKFASRVWETGPAPDGSYRVDLTVKTLRGASLTDEEALRLFVTEYHERDPGRWELEPFHNGEYDGFISSDQAFWLVEPGVAGSVIIDPARFSRPDLIRTALGFQPAGRASNQTATR